jgi:hypothetical protein
MYHGRDWDYEIQSKVFDEMTRDLNRPTATPRRKKPAPAGAVVAVTFFTVAATWLFVIALLMPCVWLLWTAAKWMFSF